MSLTRKRRDALTGYLLILPWVVGFVAFKLIPFLISLYWSFTDADLFNTPSLIGLENYTRLIADEFAVRAFANTFYYVFASVPLSQIVALTLASLLARNIRGQGVYRTLIYVPAVVSGVAVAMLWIRMFNPDFGLINRGLALLGVQGPRWIFSEIWAMPALILMSVWGVGPIAVIYLAGLQGIPVDLYDAAKVDGASPAKTFFRITLPLLTPTVLFNTVIGFIGSFQVFTQSYLMTGGGPNNATLTVVLKLYREGFEGFRFGYASAIAWGMFLIILFFTFIMFKSSAVWVFYESEIKR